nr:hypothetical protein PanWU01x14_246670 [Ipomoea batatas]
MLLSHFQQLSIAAPIVLAGRVLLHQAPPHVHHHPLNSGALQRLSGRKPPLTGLSGGDGDTLSTSAPDFCTETRRFPAGFFQNADVTTDAFAGPSPETVPASTAIGVPEIAVSWCGDGEDLLSMITVKVPDENALNVYTTRVWSEISV